MRILYHPYFDELVLEIKRLVGTRMAIADGRYFLNRTGPMAGNPIRIGLVIASDSIGAIDATICIIMGIPLAQVRYLRKAQELGWIPRVDEIAYKVSPDSQRRELFYLHRSLRSMVVACAFDRHWAVKLVWGSVFGDLIHKALYAVAGNPVDREVRRIQAERQMVL